MDALSGAQSEWKGLCRVILNDAIKPVKVDDGKRLEARGLRNEKPNVPKLAQSERDIMKLKLNTIDCSILRVCKRLFLLTIALLLSASGARAEKPNIIYLMLDEWGYFESGHMGHAELLTPNIDSFAKEGMRFTNAYAGAPVCGPTRCCLLTGLHSGHTSMRINNGFAPIREDEPTLATMLKKQGYVTGGFGKWGIGGRGTSGVPEKTGFDVFFGYYDQVHAHTYYPEYLIENSVEVPLDGNDGSSFYEGKTHAQDEIYRRSVEFIRKNKNNQFFCFLPWTPPHGIWGIDKDDPSWLAFKDKPWVGGQRSDDDIKVYAAFMHMVDRQIGELIELLRETGIDDKTVFILCGDNGGQDYFKSKDRPHGFFAPNLNPQNGERFRAGKGSLYEGGLKVPFLVRWPGRVKAGSVSDHLLYFPDVMPTLSEMTDSETPKTDGLSFLPVLEGHTEDKAADRFMYWEYGNQVAVRQGDWKAYRSGNKAWELYDLSTDVEENKSVAKSNPVILKTLVDRAQLEHETIRPGKVYREDLIQKDRLQSPAMKQRAKANAARR